ncbi:MAG: hypothetical protein EOP83_20560 [Verrucomicrobiaceae bacterium]|nr:MAG: hypothetical protein EOP83_20560 [Verrucomicrobiaceae bacterium]
MAEKKWTVFMVYGSFNDPVTNLNFFIVRMPKGRVPWSKKIAPALNRIVRGHFSNEEIQQDRVRAQNGRETHIHWNVEGEAHVHGDLWDLKRPVTRYEWNGAELVKLAA